MAISRKMEREALKAKYLDAITKLFSESEDVLRVKSNEIAFPVVGSEGNEDFIVVTVKVPTRQILTRYARRRMRYKKL